MSNTPLVSIVTPTYNHEKFIGQCIESVLAQTYKEWEMIIIDDESTDKTPEIIAQYDDDRIKYIRQKNKGLFRLSETYNKALKIASGSLIAVLEGDDFWPPNKLKKQNQSFKDKNIVLSWGVGAATDVMGNVKRYYPSNPKDFINLSKIGLLRNLLLFNNFIVAATVMARTDALISIGGFKQASYTPFVDYPTWLELSLVGNFHFVNEVMGFWRRHSNQATKKMTINIVEAGKKYAEEFFINLPSELKNKLNIQVKDIITKQNHKIAHIYFHQGRKALYEKKWGFARNMFKKAYEYGPTPLKFKALSAIFLSFFRIDMEWMNNFFDLPPL